MLFAIKRYKIPKQDKVWSLCVTCVAMVLVVVIVVEHSERWNHHRPDSWFYLHLCMRAVPSYFGCLLLIGVQKSSLGERAGVRVRRRRAVHRVTAALVTIVLGHAGGTQTETRFQTKTKFLDIQIRSTL